MGSGRRTLLVGLVWAALAGCEGDGGEGAPTAVDAGGDRVGGADVADAPGWDDALGAADSAADSAAVDGAQAPDTGGSGSADATDADEQPPGPDAAGPDAAGPDAGDAETDATADVPAPPPIAWGPCDVTDWPAGYPKPNIEVECATIDAPLDHDDPEGPTIPLRVGIHRSKSFPTGRAFFQLAGGPGGAALYQSGIVPWLLLGLRDEWDLVYVDQRGTGGSRRLDCPGGYPETGAEWRACGQALAARDDVDANHFLTQAAAHDIDLVRRTLGYERIALRGGSYGTRLGLEVLRQHGDRVSVAVLDGLVTPDLDLFAQSATGFDDGVALLADDCAADPDCAALTPDLAAALSTRRDALRETPRPIRVGAYRMSEDEQLFRELLEWFVYDARFRYRVPRAIAAARDGDNGPWNELVGEAFGQTVADAEDARGKAAPAPAARLPRRPAALLADVEYVAPGLYLTIQCAEYFPNSGGVEALAALAAGQEWGFGRVVGRAEACLSWPVDPVSRSLREPVRSSVPTLLLSGAVDLNTPWQWGDLAAATLDEAIHVVIPHTSHSTIGVPCAASLIEAFVTSGGDIAGLDTSCVDAVPHPGW